MEIYYFTWINTEVILFTLLNTKICILNICKVHIAIVPVTLAQTLSAAIQHKICGHNYQEPSGDLALAGTGMKF